MKKYYLAYGSNLNLKNMASRCPTASVIGTIELKGYRLVYKGGSDGFSYLTIEPCKDCYLPLALYEVKSLDIVALDRYEGFPELYKKEYICVTIKGKKKRALVYVMNDDFDYHIPSEDYINTCIQGYKDFGFDTSILDKALVDTKENLSKILVNRLKKD